MPYSDQLIKPLLIELSTNGAVTATKVSDETGISLRTVQRSIDRLIRSGVVKRNGKGRKWGYIYYDAEKSC